MKYWSSVTIGFTVAIVVSMIGLHPFAFSMNMAQTIFAQPTVPSNNQRPNILLLVGDDFGWSDIGAFGAEISTPNLDQLAKEGRIGTNYHTAPTCSPARAALLTGVDWHIAGLGSMYELIAENQQGKPGYETYLNDRVVTVQELLRDAGYHTIQSGKWHLSGDGITPGTTPYDRGFERAYTLVGDGGNHWNNGSMFPGGKNHFIENNTEVVRPDNVFSNGLFTDKMIDYINATPDDGNPLFMYLAFQVAHSPFMTPAGTIEKYDQIYSAGWEKVREQRFEKQKELGIWPADMTLQEVRPPNVPWDSLTPEEQDYAARILAVRAGMIEDMDQNIGRVIDHLKQIGEYDNTLIVFTSDNGGSEAMQLPEGLLLFNGVVYSAVPEFFRNMNNSLGNLGNSTSEVNYNAWGSQVSVAPLSGFKASPYEAGIRAPFIIREPTSAAAASPATTTTTTTTTTTATTTTTTTTTTTANTTSPIDSFMFVTDLTPTFLDYANVQHPGSTYNGTEVHPIMGKSIRPLLSGSAEEVHGPNDPTSSEMFNNTAVHMGSWVALNDQSHPTGTGWQLYNTKTDPAQNNNLADENPVLLQTMIADYQKYAEEVGVIPPTGTKASIQMTGLYPALNQTQTIELDEIIPPFKHPNATQLANAVRIGSEGGTTG